LHLFAKRAVGVIKEAEMMGSIALNLMAAIGTPCRGADKE
jgi:hypothetical protein